MHPLPLLKNIGTDALVNVNAYDFSQAINCLTNAFAEYPTFCGNDQADFITRQNYSISPINITV